MDLFPFIGLGSAGLRHFLENGGVKGESGGKMERERD